MTKAMLTREEFEVLRRQKAAEMHADVALAQKAIDLIHHADGYMWLHQANWMGEPMLNTPQDVLALQEIIFQTRPKYIIEVGVCWAGSLLFYSTLMEVLGGEKIIGIDIYVPDELKERIASHEHLSKRIEWIVGSSIDKSTIDQVKAIVGDCKDVLVVLDSHHTHAHVLEELRAYQQFVGIGKYLICGDTIVERLPAEVARGREWGRGNNPMTALHAFLGENNDFERDSVIENKLLLTCHPEGYLRRIK